MTVTIEIDPLLQGKPADYRFSDTDFGEDDFLTGAQVLAMLAQHGLPFDPDTFFAMTALGGMFLTPRVKRGGEPRYQALAVVYWLEHLEALRDELKRRRDPRAVQPRY